MGVIKRQTIYGSVYSYIGVIIGFVTTAVLFPHFLTEEQIGLINLLIAYSMIFSQFASLGFNNATFRLFTYFRDHEKKHNGFLFLAVAVASAGFVLSVFFIFILRDLLVLRDNATVNLLADYYYYIIPLVFFILFFNLFDSYYTVLYNSVIGTLLKEFLLRVFILAGLIGLIIHFVDFQGFVIAFTLSYLIPLLIIFFFLLRAGQINLRPQIGFLDKDMIKTLSAVSAFGIISYTADMLVFNIDRIMIDRIIGLGETGIYSTAFMFGFIVMLPSRSLFKISSTVLADAWKNNDYKNLDDIYKKSCINQFLAGTFIIILLLVNLDNIMHLLPASYHEGKWVIILVSLAMLTNMTVGVNHVVILTSKYYRVNTFFLITLAVLMILLNLILIPAFGIIGAAIATLASKIIINTLRAIFAYYKFRLQPYNYKYLLILLICAVSFLVNLALPVNDNFIVDAIIRSLVLSVLIASLSYVLKISEEMNTIVISLIKLIKRKAKL